MIFNTHVYTDFGQNETTWCTIATSQFSTTVSYLMLCHWPSIQLY